MFCPAVTGSGVSTLVTPTSIVVAAAVTVVVAIAVLLPVVVSVGEAMVAVLVIIVPFGVDAFAVTTSVKICGPLPAASGVTRLAVTVPALLTHAQPVGATQETNVVFAGTGSVSTTLCASLGPLLITVIVYVILFPAVTGSGVSTFVTETSAEVATVVVAVAVLLPVVVSVGEVTVAVLVIVVPAAAEALAFTTSVKVCAPLPAGKASPPVRVAVTVPAVLVQVQPAGAVQDTNVVLAGTGSVNVTVWASLGPTLVTVIV